MVHIKKSLSLFLSFCLIFEQSLFAQSIDLSRYFVRNSSQNILQSDKFRPLHLRYLGYDNLGQDFKILLDKGDTKKEDLDNKNYIEENTQTLLKYFFIGLSLPNEKFWVNLRPDSPDNILDPDLEKTDIGRIFLEADLQLKKDTAGMTSPQTPQGKVYWDKLYKKAGELFGTENITIPTITRPWIVPGEIIIREAPDNAYIYKATLKVMLEEDYLISRGGSRTAPTPDQYTFSDPRLKELNQYSTQLIRETIILKLTYEINTAKRYAPLRQVYYSLILAQWFKQKYGSVGSPRAPGTSAPVNSYIELIDSGNLTNLTSKEPYDKQTYFKQYQKSFKDGEYNLQEPVYTPMGQSIRRYTSGGITVMNCSLVIEGISAKGEPKFAYASSAILRGDLVDRGLNLDLKPENRDGAGEESKSRGSLVDEEIKKYLSAIETSYNDFLTKKHPSASSAVQENILRTNNNDIFGIEREGYLNHATKGIENLPESLRGNVHSLLWPVDMTNPVVHISNFQGLVLKPASVSSYSEHPGIDIQTFPGDKVFAVAEGVVVYVVDFLKKENIDKKAFGFVDVYIYSPHLQLLICYVHLDKMSVPEKILRHTYFDRYSEVKVYTGEVIGAVNTWHTNPAFPDNTKEDMLPKKVKEYYGRSYTHLHFDVSYVPESYKWRGTFSFSELSAINPLLLLKPLYKIEEQNGSSSVVEGNSMRLKEIPQTDKGGIAFNALPIQTESVASSALGVLPGAHAFKGDLDAEWAQIQAVFNAGIRPSAQRLMDFAAAGVVSPMASQRREDVLGLVAELLRRDEEDERLAPTDPTLKGLLIALESDKA